MARSTSVKDALDVLNHGTDLWKVRDKGSIRGIRGFKRKYKLDLADLSISYLPNKSTEKLVHPSACTKGEKLYDVYDSTYLMIRHICRYLYRHLLLICKKSNVSNFVLCVISKLGLNVGRIELDEICEVRAGHGTDMFNNVAGDKMEGSLESFDVGSGNKIDATRKNCFSIIFSSDHGPLDLVAENQTIRDQWVNLNLNPIILEFCKF